MKTSNDFVDNASCLTQFFANSVLFFVVRTVLSVFEEEFDSDYLNLPDWPRQW